MSSQVPATEIARLYLREGADINEESSQAYKIWQDTMKTVSSQPGFQQANFGTTLEDPSLLELMIGWDTLEAHKTFIASPQYQPFAKNLGEILSSPPILFHVTPDPSPPTFLSTSPIVEIATFYQTTTQFVPNVETFLANLKGKVKGLLDCTYGSSVEEIEKEEGSGKGKAVLLFVAWESKDAHMAFRETEIFKENIHLLREGVGAGEMHHTSFQKY